MSGALLRDGDRILVPPMMLFALYLLMAGHNRPGGGFVAGLTVSAALVLRAQARSVDEALGLLPLRPPAMLATGLGIAVVVALAPLAFGGGVLDQPFTEVALPVFGKVKLTAAFVFDIGVAVLVAGVVGAVLDAFGDQTSRPSGGRGDAPPESPAARRVQPPADAEDGTDPRSQAHGGHEEHAS